MTHPVPPVRECMSTAPATIASDRPLTEAARIMRDRGIRHLPVVDGEELVGMLSERDVTVVRSLASVNLETVRVGQVMNEVPLTVAPDTLLDEVAGAMAERRVGSAVVVDGPRVVGIFTTVDALRAIQRSWDGRL